jgi:archaellum biogenesis protein FlaJ (TadC family)
MTFTAVPAKFVLTGLGMTGLGYLRRKREEQVIRIDTFLYAFIFAFGMALIRLLHAK